MPLPLRSFLAYLARRGARSAADRAAQAELAAAAPLLGALPRDLSIEWLGCSGFRLELEGTTLLIDPYVSRVPLKSVLARRAATGDADLVARHVPRADAVLIGHAHFDHAMDAPHIARATGAVVHGSRSTAVLMGLHGLADRAVEVEPYRVYPIGPFDVTFVPSAHSKLVLGLAVNSPGDISCEHLDDLTPGAYGCGQVYGIHLRAGGATLYHQGSAELVDDAVVHRGVDVLLAGIAGRGYSSRYLERAIRHLEPRIVVPHHHDDFFRPLDQPMGFSLNVRLAGFAEEVHAVSADLPVRTMGLREPVRAPAT